jgi:hypothetical protein
MSEDILDRMVKAKKEAEDSFGWRPCENGWEIIGKHDSEVLEKFEGTDFGEFWERFLHIYNRGVMEAVLMTATRELN